MGTQGSAALRQRRSAHFDRLLNLIHVGLAASPEREHFFEFNWWYFIGLVAVIIGAWRSDGPWLVLGSLAGAGLIAGVWFSNLAAEPEPGRLTLANIRF